MGNSVPAAAADGDDLAEFDGIETLGYRVLGVQPNSPASKAGLVSFFDFIVGANGEMLMGSGEDLEEGEEYDDIDFPQLLRGNQGKAVGLLVWNIKSQEKRLVELVPNDDWPGAGLLGVTIRLDNYGGADERLIRVLEVEQNSPASIAGLVPMQDYLLGTTAVSFESTKVLAKVLQRNCDQVVEIYVYNSESDIVRVVALMPTTSWGAGNGLLGAEVGVGYLHRLPNHCRQTIGHSVERKVRLRNRKDDDEIEEPSVPVMEPHLEMEIENGDRKPEDISKQPHELGSSCEAENETTQSINTQQEDPKKFEKIESAAATDQETSTQSVEHQSSSTKEALPVPSSEPVAEEKRPEQEKGHGSNLPDLPSPPKMTY